MKKLVCEICGGTDLVKEDGVFVCQYCGTKYSVEEAKKLMIEGTVDVSGSTVKVDDTKRTENLYILARRAKDSGDSDNAQKYYGEIAIECPDDWEAAFYHVYTEPSLCIIADISKKADAIKACLPTVFSLIKNDSDDTNRKNNANEVAQKVIEFGAFANRAAQAHWVQYEKVSGVWEEFMDRCTHIMYMLEKLGDEALDKINDRDVARRAYNAALHYGANKTPISAQSWNAIQHKLKAIDASHKVRQVSPSGGCYIATAVYGSYDCPEVWTLRRFRDFELAETWYGRIFIRLYYAISPKLVKAFGKRTWFEKLFKKRLDKLVDDLNKRGYSSTPYED